jgi:hypothetical protein
MKNQDRPWYLEKTGMLGLSPNSHFLNYFMLLVREEFSWTFTYSQQKLTENSTDDEK